MKGARFLSEPAPFATPVAATPTPMDDLTNLTALFILAVPIACIAWTVTHEEIFREPREYCVRRHKRARTLWERKLFYVFTCEFCFSHWVTLLALAVTGFRLLYPDWRGLVIAFFSLVWIANIYMGLYGRIRLDLKQERLEIATQEAVLEGVNNGSIPVVAPAVDVSGQPVATTPQAPTDRAG
jgi:hypothetical protein